MSVFYRIFNEYKNKSPKSASTITHTWIIYNAIPVLAVDEYQPKITLTIDDYLTDLTLTKITIHRSLSEKAINHIPKNKITVEYKASTKTIELKTIENPIRTMLIPVTQNPEMYETTHLRNTNNQ